MPFVGIILFLAFLIWIATLIGPLWTIAIVLILWILS